MNDEPDPEGVRLHVFLARAGCCSRRAGERLMAEGKVSVNGVPIRTPGQRVVPGRDVVTVAGESIVLSPALVKSYVLLYKPRGVVTTAKDERGRQTVLDLLPLDMPRLFPVGRLDRDSEGLLLLTDDGELAYRLTHPRYNVEKRYRVLIRGRLTGEEEDAFRRSLPLPEGETRAASLHFKRCDAEEAEYEVVLREGKKRQIRRMMELLGYPVRRLCRIGEAGIRLEDLQPGMWRFLRSAEVRRLKREVSLP